MTPIILEKLNQLSGDEKLEFVKSLENHLIKKDIMIFAKDAGLANLFLASQIDGSVYELPHSFWGSYLAVVGANIAGGKSDVFLEQTIDGRFDIDTDGSIFVDLTIQREHRGDKEKDWWWRADNKSFTQIFTNPNANLINIKGNGQPRSKISDIDYQVDGYEVNSDLAAIEATKIFLVNQNTWTMDAFGKKVFGAWFNTPAGSSNALNLRYQVPSRSDFAISSGEVFQFIFERQSGVKSKIVFKVGAPFGYRWAKNQSAVFTYEEDDPDGLVILNLTLQK